MSLVIGVKIQNAILFVSDGLALVGKDDKKNNTSVKKLYTYSKINSINPGRVVFSYVGSTELSLKVLKSTFDTEKKELGLAKHEGKLNEVDFINNIQTQILDLNKKFAPEKPPIAILIGYFDKKNNSKMVFFDQNGKAISIAKHLSIGAGSERINEELLQCYNQNWTINEAAYRLIDLIYLGSEVPTVNFLPMITVLTNNDIHDLSGNTIDLFQQFKKQLKSELLNELNAVIGKWLN